MQNLHDTTQPKIAARAINHDALNLHFASEERTTR